MQSHDLTEESAQMPANALVDEAGDDNEMEDEAERTEHGHGALISEAVWPR